MISPEQRAKIRRLFYAEHWRIGTIAAELGVHHDTVRAAIEAHRFRNPPPRIRASPLEPYKPFIIEILQKYPRLRATRLHQMLQARGFTGSVRQVRRYVRTVRPARTREAFMRMQTLPGEQAQVDWGSFGWLQVGRARRRLSCFVMVLSHSRAMYARFSLNQTAPSFLHSHVEAFEYFGGVPREILYDNLKSVVLERDGDHIRFHPTILELAGHYHFAPKPCAPYRANEKGRVERSIQYLRHSFFTAREPTEIDALNRDLLAWMDHVAHARPQPRDPDARTVGAAFLEEKASLLPLPEHAFPCELVKAVRSGKTPFIRFDLNDYSIPHAYVRQPLTLVADDRHVRFLSGIDVIARHERSWDRGQVVRDDRHLADLAAEKRRGRALMGRDRLRHHCPSTEAMLQAIAQRNQPIRSQTAHLNRLIDRYGAETVEQAMAKPFGAARRRQRLLRIYSIDRTRRPGVYRLSKRSYPTTLVSATFDSNLTTSRPMTASVRLRRTIREPIASANLKHSACAAWPNRSTMPSVSGRKSDGHPPSYLSTSFESNNKIAHAGR